MPRLHKVSLIRQLMAAHPEVAAGPLNWEIDGQPDLWAQAPYGTAEAETAARTLAAALGAGVEVHVVKGRHMYSVYGKWLGTSVSLHSFGPLLPAVAEVPA
jgi:hypothetical protein